MMEDESVWSIIGRSVFVLILLTFLPVLMFAAAAWGMACGLTEEVGEMWGAWSDWVIDVWRDAP